MHQIDKLLIKTLIKILNCFEHLKYDENGLEKKQKFLFDKITFRKFFNMYSLCTFNYIFHISYYLLYLIIYNANFVSIIFYHWDLEKQGDLRDCFLLLTVTQLWNVAQGVSRAPPYQTLPAFLNPNGRFTVAIGYFVISAPQNYTEEPTGYKKALHKINHPKLYLVFFKN